MYRNAWCEIDLVQFRRNLTTLTNLAQTRALLVVKANAYGHGLLPIAREAETVGIDMFGVATIGEAEQLLKGGISAPILLICALDHEEIDYCVANGLHFLAWRVDQFERAMQARDRYHVEPRIHLEIDTGMSRSGIYSNETTALLERLTPAMRESVVGLATHFFLADGDATDSAEAQLDEFLGVARSLETIGMQPLCHTANSPGTIRIPRSRLDMVRLGVISYGLKPSDAVEMPDGIGPILSWRATVTNIKTVPAGRGISYGWEFVAERDERVATIGIGYADGFRRTPPAVNTVIIDGQEAAVLGRVCMDQCVVRIPSGTRCDIGSVVTLIGKEGGVELTADDLATRWQTINYDVVCGIRDRVPRRYSGTVLDRSENLV